MKVEEKVVKAILNSIPESDDEDEQFEDASDGEAVNEANNNIQSSFTGLPPTSGSGKGHKNEISLQEALEDGRQMMINFVNNEFDEAVKLCFEKGDRNMVYAAGMGMIKALESCLTLDPSLIGEAITYMRFANEFANTLRKKHGYTSFLFKADYNLYTDEEAHAEMIYAKTLIVIGLLSIVEDQSIYGLVNSAFTIRASHQTYKECLNILEKKTNWETDSIRMHFESGTRLGIGAFDLFVSMFPNKLAKLLEYVGFHSNRDIALDELNKSVNLPDGLLYDISSILLSTYYGFVEFFYGCGEPNMAFFEKQSKVWQRRTPNSSIAKIGLAIMEQITGNPTQAIVLYNECVFGQSIWKQLHLASSWGMTWCYAMQCDWVNAAKTIKILKDTCKVSPAMFAYLYAVFQFMVMTEDNKPELREEISKTLKRIPLLKRKVGGRKVFHERIVIDRSKRFHNNIDGLVLPPFELSYIWNLFQMMGGKKENIQPYLDRVDSKFLEFKDDKGEADKCLDSYCYLLFMRGVCYRHLGNSRKATDCFEEVLSCKKRINFEQQLLPQACFELGSISRKLGELPEAKKWFKRARDDYSGYLTEIMIQYRSNQQLQNIKMEMES
ncbi:Tetratricopeptide repeat protein 39B [Halotydeus destructor]|nr:Tetratricopeptide repeat protein 39B [Halotydeus destructor]